MINNTPYFLYSWTPAHLKPLLFTLSHIHAILISISISFLFFFVFTITNALTNALANALAWT